MNVAAVLITRNQEGTIGALIESVLREVQRGQVTEIVVVDSASTDQSVDVASSFPIRVLRLDADQVLTAAAGRRLGAAQTHAPYVLFLDGDMQLCEGWIEAALELAARDRVGVVTGTIVDVDEDASPSPPRRSDDDDAVVVSKHFAGAALCAREALEAVGSFDPWLRSDEEPELAIRIRRAGWTILKTGRPIAYHYTPRPGSVWEILARRRRRLYVGHGQAVRISIRGGYGMAYLRERGFSVVPLLVLVVGTLAAAATLATGRGLYLAVWLVALATLLGAAAFKRRSLSVVIRSVALRLCILEGLVRGALLRPQPRDSHPLTFSSVK